MDTYKVRPRKDRRGVDLISDALPLLSCRFAAFIPSPRKNLSSLF
jgi:hypothetical protein